MPGESPYIGKCCFHKNEYATEHRARAKPSEVRHGTVNGSTRTAAVSQGRLDFVNIDRDMTSEIQDEKQRIDVELQDKIHTLAEGLFLPSVNNIV